jgi:nucleoside-diphosphate-sugar epimerase
MKALITGTTGFIGSHVFKTLCEKGMEVKCLVRKSSKVEQLKKEGAELAYGDLLDKDSLHDAIRGVDIIYHLAGEVYSTEDKNYHLNVIGTKNLLDACLSGNIKKFIYLSSIAAVGPNSGSGVVWDENSPCSPISPYGRSKYEAEQLLLETFRTHGLPVVIIRPPIVYGPRVSRSSRVFMFVHLINRGLYRAVGDGKNLISMCYVDNLIQGILLAGEKEGTEGKIYFIADEKPYTINEIAEAIAREEGVRLSSFHMPIWLANIMAVILSVPSKLLGFVSPLSLDKIREMTSNWVCNISKAERELGYRPITTFEQGIKKTVEWYSAYLKTAHKEQR